MKKILLWDPRFPDRKPSRLTVDDTVASAAVRAGVAAAADPVDAGALAAGAVLDQGLLTPVLLQHGFQGGLVRVMLPYSVVLVGAAAGVLAGIGTPIAGVVTPNAGATSGFVRTLNTLASAMVAQSAPVFAPGVADAATIIIDRATTFQPFLGVGAALTDSAVANLLRMSLADRTALFTEMFVTNGMGCVRLCMGTSDFSRTPLYTYNDTNTDGTDTAFSIQNDIDRGVVQIAKEIKAVKADVTFFAMPWTPPAFLKSGGSLNGGIWTESNANYAFYADYFVRYVQAYAAQGITISYVAVQNEPNANKSQYPSCAWTATNISNFIKGNLGPAFASAGITTKILLNDCAWGDTGTFVSTPLGVPATKAYVAGVAYHGYNGTPDRMTTDLAGNPTLEVHCTEFRTFLNQDYPTSTQIMAGDWFIGSFRNGARSVMCWNMALDETGSPVVASTGRRGFVVVNSTNPALSAVTRSAEYYIAAHISRYVKRGATRIDSTSLATGSTGTDVESVAFLNPDGSTVVFLWNAAATAKVIPVQDKATGQKTSITLEAGAFGTVTYNGLVASTTPVVSVVGAVSHPEGNSSTTTYTFTVARNTTTGAVNVPWAFAAGATSPDDFAGGSYPAGGTVAIADGASQGAFTLNVNGDTTVEPDEQFTVSITAPSGYTVGTASATGTILNDDASTSSPVVLDTEAGVTTTSYATQSIPLTIAADANLLVVDVAFGVPADSGPTTDYPPTIAPTINGIAMIEIGHGYSTGNVGKDRGVQSFYLQNPPTGAQTVAIAITKAAQVTGATFNMVARAASYRNATGIGTYAEQHGTTSTGVTQRQVTTTSPNANCIVRGVGAIRSTTAPTAPAAQTVVTTLSGTNMYAMFSRQTGGAGALTEMDWTTADQSSLLAYPIFSA